MLRLKSPLALTISLARIISCASFYELGMPCSGDLLRWSSMPCQDTTVVLLRRLSLNPSDRLRKIQQISCHNICMMHTVRRRPCLPHSRGFQLPSVLSLSWCPPPCACRPYNCTQANASLSSAFCCKHVSETFLHKLMSPTNQMKTVDVIEFAGDLVTEQVPSTSRALSPGSTVNFLRI